MASPGGPRRRWLAPRSGTSIRNLRRWLGQESDPRSAARCRHWLKLAKVAAKSDAAAFFFDQAQGVDHRAHVAHAIEPYSQTRPRVRHYDRVSKRRAFSTASRGENPVTRSGPTRTKLTALCTEAEYDDVFDRAWTRRQTISEYLRSMLGFTQPDAAEQRRVNPPAKDRCRTTLVASCTEAEYEVVFAQAWNQGRLIGEYVRIQLGLRTDGWVQPGRRKRRH